MGRRKKRRSSRPRVHRFRDLGVAVIPCGKIPSCVRRCRAASKLLKSGWKVLCVDPNLVSDYQAEARQFIETAEVAKKQSFGDASGNIGFEKSREAVEKR